MLSLLKPYTATEDMPWNLRRVVHLHRRAGFAAWGEISLLKSRWTGTIRR